MTKIRFEAELFKIGSWTIVLLPRSASLKLPSRGMVMVNGTIDDFHFQAPLEPDGRGSHWFRFTEKMQAAAGAGAGDTLTLEIEPTKAWPEPDLPADLQKALDAEPQIQDLWHDITPMARWDWIRWIGSTNNPETRKKHIVVAFSKLRAGTRRPCCFNRALCTVAAVSKGGLLLEPAAAVTAK